MASLYEIAQRNFAQPQSTSTLALPSNITPPGGGVPVTSQPPSIVTDAFRRASQYINIASAESQSWAERVRDGLLGRSPSSGGSVSGGSGNGTTPASPADPDADPYFQTLADAMAALFSGNQTSGRDAGLVAYPVSPTSSGGGGVNGKMIVFLVIAAIVGWWAWKKYGKKAAAAATA